MGLQDPLNKLWQDRARHRTYDRLPCFTEAGLCLGAGTVLVKAMGGKVRLAGAGERVLALLGVTHGFPVEPEILPHLARAAQAWNAGDETRALIHVAFARLPPLPDRASAHRLFLSAGLLDGGFTPRDLGKLAGFTEAGDIIWKRGYDPGQPRKPSGPGGGEWARAAGGSNPGIGATPTIPAGDQSGGQPTDATRPDGLDPFFQNVAFLDHANIINISDDIPVIPPAGTPIYPYGESFVPLENLPMNARQILKYRVIFYDKETLTYRLGFHFPVSGTDTSPTYVRRGQDAGQELSGFVVSPPGSPPVIPRENPRSSVRFGNFNNRIGGPYFVTYNDGGQIISPVTGATVAPDVAHYPVDFGKSLAQGFK